MLPGKGTLKQIQKNALSHFSELQDSGRFYLTGGTALSEFYLGHRLSHDLDFFTCEAGLIVPFSLAMESELRKKGLSLAASRRFETFAELEFEEEEEKTVFHLALDSPFRFAPPVESDHGIKVNDYTDIVVDKLLAFFGRSEPRDAVDVFFILKREAFWKLVALAQEKDPGFDLYWLAVALSKTGDLPDEIDRWPVDMLIEVGAREIKETFSALARAVMEKIRKDR
jgi:hypothetical protein